MGLRGSELVSTIISLTPVKEREKVVEAFSRHCHRIRSMEDLFSHQLLLLLGLTVCLSLTSIIIRRIFFHPLMGVSGPLLGKFTDLPTLLAVVKKNRTFQQYELLQKYGSPLRIGTNHLIFSDSESFASIYGQSSSPCLKDRQVYDGLSATGEINVLNVADRHQHARLRRLISHSFALKSLLESETFIQSKIEEYVSQFQGKNKESVDIMAKTHELYLDIVSQLSFGESFDCLAGKNSTAHKDVQAFFTVVPALSFAPFLRYLPIKTLREGARGLARLVEFSRAHVSAYVAQSAEKLHVGSGGKFLQNLASAVDAETGTKLRKEELVENAIIFLIAGSGTTASTTMYLIWECGKQPAIRKRLIHEIRTAFPDPNKMPSYQEASKLVGSLQLVAPHSPLTSPFRSI